MISDPILEAQLVLHEGLKLHIYLDTEGNQTLGVGYNVTARGLDFFEEVVGRRLLGGGDIITKAEAMMVLREDIDRYYRSVPLHFAFFEKLNPARKRVVLDMAFNMGFRALGFKQTIAAVEKENWSSAVMGLYNSRWARQVGDGPGGRRDRCDRLAGMLLTGLDATDVPSIT